MQWNFQGRVALVTGGAGGLGEELCKALLEAGASVHVCERNSAKLEQTRRTAAKQFGEQASYYVAQVDVRDVDALRAWVHEVDRKEGHIDILVNAAGVCPTAGFREVDEAIWDETVDVNLKGTFFASQAAGERMMRQGSGRIINISSVGAYTGGAVATPPYCAAKAGILALTKSFANALSPHGICVNSVAPGPFRTEMIASFPVETMKKIEEAAPNRRIGESADIVSTILFLADDSSRHITGACIDVNGGLYMR